jgi:hypothetical protein
MATASHKVLNEFMDMAKKPKSNRVPKPNRVDVQTRWEMPVAL